MPAPTAPAQCPRCGADFDCGASRAEPCACLSVALTQATIAQLRERYAGCLCVNCLTTLAGDPARDVEGSVRLPAAPPRA